MAFTLRVDFAGLCLYVRHRTNGQQVAVLLPDCRKSTNPNLVHLDGTDAEPHVGYVRLDMRDLGLTIAGPATEPRYELVHRFDKQILKFGGAVTAEPINTSDLHYPNFDYMGFPLDLLPNLFTPNPPAALLARMVLDGGSLVATPIPNDWWEFPQVGDPAGPTYTSQFASSATWTRTFTGNTLTVRFSDFADNEEQAYPMAVPEGATVTIKVANLCCHNPLEWRDLTSRKVKGPDADFKWLYKLLMPRGASYPDLLNGAELPHPRLVAGPGAETGSDDCIAGKTTADFP